MRDHDDIGIADARTFEIHNAALEKAAARADEYALCYSRDSLPAMVASDIAAAIRELKVKQ